MLVQSLHSEDSPGEGNCYPLLYSCLENPMDRGAWRATIHEVANSYLEHMDVRSVCLFVGTSRLVFLQLK